MERDGTQMIEDGVAFILQGLASLYGLNSQDENFKDTPARVARAYAEIFGGLRDTDMQVEKILSATFPGECKEMIIARGIRVYSMCPHHLLPVEYTVNLAYIPAGRVLGVSKLARLSSILAKRPVLQETLTEDIANKLFLGIQSGGSAVFVEGTHYCMKMRGAYQQESKIITSALRGVFLQPEVRAEFLSLVGR